MVMNNYKHQDMFKVLFIQFAEKSEFEMYILLHFNIFTSVKKMW